MNAWPILGYNVDLNPIYLRLLGYVLQIGLGRKILVMYENTIQIYVSLFPWMTATRSTLHCDSTSCLVRSCNLAVLLIASLRFRRVRAHPFLKDTQLAVAKSFLHASK